MKKITGSQQNFSNFRVINFPLKFVGQIVGQKWLSWVGKCLILLLLFFLISWAWTFNAFAEDLPDVFLRTSLEPENPVVGQQVKFNVDVLVNTWFAKAPKFSEIQVDDTIAFLPPNATLNLVERIGNQTYAGQRHTYFLFPQLPGRYYIPSISVRIVPGGGVGEPITLSTEKTSLMAQLPPELTSESFKTIIATPRLEVKTEVKTNGNFQLKRLQVGNTIERTVTISAMDTLAPFLPSINPGDRSGLDAYPDPPLLTNRFERGQLKAIRSDRISYVASRPGRYQLPSLSIVWWNTQTQSLEKTEISEVEIRVKPTLKQLLLQFLVWLAILAALLGIFFYHRKDLQLLYQNYQRQRAESEPVVFRRLRQACFSNNAKATWAEFRQWLECTSKNSQTTTVNDFLIHAEDPALTEEVEKLERLLFGQEKSKSLISDWSGAKLYQSLYRVRKPWLRLLSKTNQKHSIYLYSLNPPLQ